jgi:hypothetical protein
MPGQQNHATAIALPTPRPAPRSYPLAPGKSTSRSLARSTSAFADFHDLAGHAGPADGCGACQAQQQRQNQGAAALRNHQRQTRQRIDAILGNVCPACTYDPCVCAGTDEATDLRRDADAYGLGEDLDDAEPWGWSE